MRRLPEPGMLSSRLGPRARNASKEIGIWHSCLTASAGPLAWDLPAAIARTRLWPLALQRLLLPAKPRTTRTAETESLTACGGRTQCARPGRGDLLRGKSTGQADRHKASPGRGLGTRLSTLCLGLEYRPIGANRKPCRDGGSTGYVS